MTRNPQFDEWGRGRPSGEETQAAMWAAIRKQEAAREPLIRQGKTVLVSTFDHSGRIKLLFVNKEGRTAYWVSREEYRWRPRGKVVLTLEDFPNAKPAKNTDLYDGEYDIAATARRAEVVHARIQKKRRKAAARLSR